MQAADFDLSMNIEIEKFLVDYIQTLEKLLIVADSKVTDDRKREILKAAWDAIAKNSIWYLGNYRLNLSTGQDKIVPVPIYELAFSSRLIIEAASDLEYYYFADNKELDLFFKESEDLSTMTDEKQIKHICKINYRDYYMPKVTTMKRLRKCFGKSGIGYYNTLCRNNHLNYLGYKLSLNNLFTYDIRTHGLIFILAALDTLREVLEKANLINTGADLDSFIKKSDYYVKKLKEQK